MGAGASLPETIDKATARALAGERFDEVAFDARKGPDGTVGRADFLAAAGVEVADTEEMTPSSGGGAPSKFLAANYRTPAPPLQAAEHASSGQGAYEQEMVTAALSLSHVQRGDAFLGAETRPDTVRAVAAARHHPSCHRPDCRHGARVPHLPAVPATHRATKPPTTPPTMARAGLGVALRGRMGLDRARRARCGSRRHRACDAL